MGWIVSITVLCTPLLKTKGARVSEAMRAGDARAEGPGCRFSHRGTNATPPPLDNPRPALAGLLKEVENSQHNNPSFPSFKIIRIIVQIRQLTVLRQEHNSHVAIVGEVMLGGINDLFQS